MNLEVIKAFLDEYSKEYGAQKTLKMYKFLTKSNKTIELINESINRKHIPSGKDFILVFMSHIRYAFAKPDTITAGSVILIMIWLDQYEKHVTEVPEAELGLAYMQICKEVNKMRFD